MLPLFKVTIIGKSTVGKTSIVKRLRENIFNDRLGATIGAEFTPFIYEGHKYDFWDTAGQERYDSLMPMYYKNSKIILFTFDVNDIETFNKFQYYCKTIEACGLEDYRIIIIGNKIDLIENDDDLEYIKTNVKTMMENHEIAHLIYDILYLSAKENTNFDLLKNSLKNCSQLLIMDINKGIIFSNDTNSVIINNNENDKAVVEESKCLC